MSHAVVFCLACGKRRHSCHCGANAWQVREESTGSTVGSVFGVVGIVVGILAAIPVLAFLVFTIVASLS